MYIRIIIYNFKLKILVYINIFLFKDNKNIIIIILVIRVAPKGYVFVKSFMLSFKPEKILNPYTNRPEYY